jgi:hypothetical protein
MIEISFTTATSDEDDGRDEDGADTTQQDETPTIAPITDMPPAAALTSPNKRDKDISMTPHHDHTDDKSALPDIPPSPIETNHATSEPPTPEAMPKSHNPPMTEPQKPTTHNIHTIPAMNDPTNTTPPHQTPTNRPNENNTTYDPPTLPPAPSTSNTKDPKKTILKYLLKLRNTTSPNAGNYTGNSARGQPT